MYSVGHDPNIATDTPDFGYYIFGGWSCEDWVLWFYSLKKAYGYDQAKATWRQWWESWTNYFGSSYSWCKYNTSFADFLKTENIEGQTNIISNTVVTGTKVTNSVLDTIESTVKVGGVLVPVVLVVGVALLLLVAANKAGVQVGKAE